MLTRTGGIGRYVNNQMKDSSLLALIVAVYAALAVIFYVVTTVKIRRPFLIPLLTEFFYTFVPTGSSL